MALKSYYSERERNESYFWQVRLLDKLNFSTPKKSSLKVGAFVLLLDSSSGSMSFHSFTSWCKNKNCSVRSF